MFRGTKGIFLKVSTLFGCNMYYEIDAQHFSQLYMKKRDCIVAGSPSVSLLRDLSNWQASLVRGKSLGLDPFCLFGALILPLYAGLVFLHVTIKKQGSVLYLATLFHL